MAGAFRRAWGRVARLGRLRAATPTAQPPGDFEGILSQHDARRAGPGGAPRIFKAPGLVDVPPLHRQPGPNRRSANPTGAHFIGAEHYHHGRSFQ
jgi:hypothetical protein